MIQWHDGGRKIPGSSDKDMVDDDDDDDENDGVDTYADLDFSTEALYTLLGKLSESDVPQDGFLEMLKHDLSIMIVSFAIEDDDDDGDNDDDNENDDEENNMKEEDQQQQQQQEEEIFGNKNKLDDKMSTALTMNESFDSSLTDDAL